MCLLSVYVRYHKVQSGADNDEVGNHIPFASKVHDTHKVEAGTLEVHSIGSLFAGTLDIHAECTAAGLYLLEPVSRRYQRPAGSLTILGT